jgi:hypothetical protein
MNRQHFLILAIIFIFCASPLHALPSKENDLKNKKNEDEKIIVVASGVVRLVGSGAFSEIVIRGENVQWYIAGEDREKLHNLQHRFVTVEGEETVKELRFAGGQSAGKRRELGNITLISVE